MKVTWRLYWDDFREFVSWRTWLFTWFRFAFEGGTTTVFRVCGVSIHRYHYREFEYEPRPLPLDHSNT